MVLGSIVTGMMGGLAAAMTAWSAGHPLMLVLFWYSVIGSLCVLSSAAYVASRRDPAWLPEN
jgi:hypothetical protein